MASIVGIIHRQNKLITVDPLKRRYVAAVGDVIVGRITEISGKRWRVDVNGQGETVLLLSAVHLPGGEQRRRTAEDELSMREVFAEGDLVSAEVQKVQHDGIVMLHTRSIKYGLLKGGLLVTVPASLIKRQKQHFQHIETLGIDIIMGRNGMIWVAPHRKSREEGGLMEVDSSCDIHRELRECIARVAQAIRVLARLNFMVSSESIVSTYSLSLREKMPAKEMMRPGFMSVVAENEASGREHTHFE